MPSSGHKAQTAQSRLSVLATCLEERKRGGRPLGRHLTTLLKPRSHTSSARAGIDCYLIEFSQNVYSRRTQGQTRARNRQGEFE